MNINEVFTCAMKAIPAGIIDKGKLRRLMIAMVTKALSAVSLLSGDRRT